MRWTLGVGCLAAWPALAADLDGDGCEDAPAALNGACVHPSASVAPDATIGAGAQVGALASVGPDVDLGAGATLAPRASLAGRLGGAAAQPVGDGTVIGRRTAIGPDAEIGALASFARAGSVGAELTAGERVVVGYAAQLGDRVTLGARAVVGNLARIDDDAELGADVRVGRDAWIGPRADVFASVGPDAQVGADAQIAADAKVRRGAQLGADTVVGAGAVVGRGAVVGAGVVLEPGAVVRAGAALPDCAVVDGTATVSAGQAWTGSTASPACGLQAVGGVWTLPDGSGLPSCLAYLNHASYTGEGDGVYALTVAAGGTRGVFCDMAGGGWTLALRAADSGDTFRFHSAHWTNDTELNVAGDPSPTANVDAKLHPFNELVASEVRGCLRNLSTGAYGCRTYAIPGGPRTLRSAFASVPSGATSTLPGGAPEATAWLTMWGRSTSELSSGVPVGYLQPGFNLDDSASCYHARVRLGAGFNNETTIDTMNDAVGFGASSYYTSNCGLAQSEWRVSAGLASGSTLVRTRGQIWVR